MDNIYNLKSVVALQSMGYILDWKYIKALQSVGYILDCWIGSLSYRRFHEKGTFSVHSFNDNYLSIPERPGSYKYLFHEIPVILVNNKL